MNGGAPPGGCPMAGSLPATAHAIELHGSLRVTVYYTGRVQGVGFRYTVRRLACGYDVAGTVRNMPDGEVRLEAEGERGELESFLQSVRDSGLGPHIRDERISRSECAARLRGFEILP